MSKFQPTAGKSVSKCIILLSLNFMTEKFDSLATTGLIPHYRYVTYCSSYCVQNSVRTCMIMWIIREVDDGDGNLDFDGVDSGSSRISGSVAERT